MTRYLILCLLLCSCSVPSLSARPGVTKVFVDGVTTDKARDALRQSIKYFRDAGIELEYYDVRTFRRVLFLRDATLPEVLGWPSYRGLAQVNGRFANVRLGPWTGFNAKLIAHEVAHLLGAGHSWTGIEANGAWSLLTWPIHPLDLATGFSDETKKQMGGL
jgi:hypothetical protein